MLTQSFSMKKEDENLKLTMFLYLLMRDELPTGNVTKLVNETIDAYNDKDSDVYLFSTGHLASYAYDLVRLLKK